MLCVWLDQSSASVKAFLSIPSYLNMYTSFTQAFDSVNKSPIFGGRSFTTHPRSSHTRATCARSICFVDWSLLV